MGKDAPTVCAPKRNPWLHSLPQAYMGVSTGGQHHLPTREVTDSPQHPSRKPSWLSGSHLLTQDWQLALSSECPLW
jgi:hypothetical protein